MLFQTQKNPKTVDFILKDLDQNKDDKLDFEEFLPLVVGLSMACEKCYMLHNQKKGKKWWANMRESNYVQFFSSKIILLHKCVSDLQVKTTFNKSSPSVCLIVF